MLGFIMLPHLRYVLNLRNICWQAYLKFGNIIGSR